MALRLDSGSLPDDWQLVGFGDCAEILMGQSPTGDTYNTTGTGIPLLNGPAEFGRKFPTAVQWTTSPTRMANSGDILFCVRGNTTGRMNIADKPYCIGRGLAAIRGKPANDETSFVSFLLEFIKPRIYGVAVGGGSTFPNISRASLLEFNVPKPPLAEQRKIAGVLELVQRALEQQERLIVLTTELKKALLHQLFTSGLRGEPQKQTEIGPVPESWEVVTLQEVCSFLSGGTPSKQKPEFWSGSIPWVSPKDMKKPRLSDVVDHISEAALEDGSSLAPAGAVFVVIRGMILAKDVPIALAEVPMAFNQDMKAIIPGPRIEPSFLLYALVAFKQHLFQKIGRSAHGTMTLMSSELAQFTIPLPDKSTQRKVAEAIETIERKHEQHQRKHAALTALFRTLLHQLMTAQIRVHDLDLAALGVEVSGEAEEMSCVHG